jgi:nucleoside-diphosphate-sugar epimerase
MTALDGALVLIAGGTGLAGSAVVRALLREHPGARAVVPHRGRDGAFVDDPRVRYVVADLTDPAQCAAAVQGCDMAVLAAAVTGGAKASAEAPWLQVTDNVVIDARLMQACHDAGVKRWVYVSTASAYQRFDGAIREDEMDWTRDPAEAHLGVGWVKRYGEKACWFWRQKAGVEAIILRLSNVFGPYARFDPAVSNFIPAIIRKAVDRMDPFEVWGSPAVTRDVVYAGDFADSVLAALTRRDIQFDTFNIGSGERTTVGDVVQWALEAAGHEPSQMQFGDSAQSVLTYRALDVSKARFVLRWSAAVGAADGVRRTVAWWLRNKDTWLR